MMMCRRDEEALMVAKAVVADVVSVARERRRVITIDGLDICFYDAIDATYLSMLGRSLA
jgi:uncharacterized metal-binding protein